MNKIFSILAAVLLLSACYEPKTDEEKEFVKICTSANKELSDKSCGCIYNRQSNLESLQYTINFYQEKIRTNEQQTSLNVETVGSVEEDTNSGDLERAIIVAFNENACK